MLDPRSSSRAEAWLTALIVALAVPVHLAGLFAPGLYRDPPVLLPQNLGTDLVTLALVLPLLAVSAWRRDTPRGRVLWLGALGYAVYAYGMYALGVHWNPLFLAYAALFGLSFFALALGLLRTDLEATRAALAPAAPVKLVSSYLFAVAFMVGAVWLADEIAATVAGTPPRSLAELDAPTNIVHVFDLSIVLPALVVAGLLLRRGGAWGYVLAGMLLVKATAIGLWVVAMIGFSARAGYPAPAAYTVLFVALTLVGAWVTARFLGVWGRKEAKLSSALRERIVS